MKQELSDIITIIDGCKSNQRAMQKELYQMYYGIAMSICTRYSSTEEEAQEIMNDGFMKVFKYLKKFDTTKPFKPWLSKIMVNTAIDYFNKKKNQIETLDLNHGIIEESEGNVLDTIAYQEMLEIVRRLPPAYQTIFNLRAIEGYKHEEIAKMLNISVGTSKSNYSRAKNKLKLEMESFFEVNS